ncbi:hypothetical protein DFH08DRAFT_1078441 [Mycena albidolilacea]|uniref:Uncharacterized protein n=1 Tax=Mycena albidolilacea TaxID=1033008 RepID=A0AAD7A7Q4_9AGAR|nr:hypothetical protein DFH08DRAFT_1078441 [Mycena albidolilacea]
MPTQRVVASLFALTLALMHVSAQNVTLHVVSQDIPSGSQANQISFTASDSISVGGTNSHGGTTYVDVEVLISEVVIQPHTTITVSSAPTTDTFTWVEDASGFQQTNIRSVNGITPETAVETCGFGTDGRGTCVESLVSPQTTETITFSGNVVPYFTLVAASPSSSSSSSSSKKNAALRTAYTGWNVLSAVVVMALFQVA